MKEINITSGEIFNNYIKERELGLFIPFNEAMIEGTPIYPPFSKEFIEERTITHNCVKSEYKSVTYSFLNIKDKLNEYANCSNIP